MRERLKQMLDELLVTHAPGGMEQEIDAVVIRHLENSCSDVEHDAHGNLYARVPGTDGGPLTLLSAHKDELSLIVHKIDEDGKMWVEPIGGSRPAKYGEGPFDLITPNGVLEGVLCVGSTHCSDLSARVHRAKTQSLEWNMVYLDCKLNAAELKEKGAMVGDRAVPGRRRKQPLYLGEDYVCGYALDDKAGVAVLLQLACMLAETAPRHDLCLAITCCEEGGVSGGSYLARHLDPHDFIAVEVAPVAEEYPFGMADGPVILFKDSLYHYSPDLSRDLIAAGGRCGLECRSAVLRAFGSDASVTAKAGLNGRAACVGFPTENTHGYEITRLSALEQCVKLLFEYFTAAR